MFARMRTASKFFAIGLTVGLLFAPQSGEVLRRQIKDRIGSAVPGR